MPGAPQLVPRDAPSTAHLSVDGINQRAGQNLGASRGVKTCVPQTQGNSETRASVRLAWGRGRIEGTRRALQGCARVLPFPFFCREVVALVSKVLPLYVIFHLFEAVCVSPPLTRPPRSRPLPEAGQRCERWLTDSQRGLTGEEAPEVSTRVGSVTQNNEPPCVQFQRARDARRRAES